MFDIVVCKETQSKADRSVQISRAKSSTKILYINNELVDGSCIRARSKSIFFSLQICKWALHVMGQRLFGMANNILPMKRG
jgi:hypothetical protein